jgi:uncharacterized RmlC-like cupin family protein
MDAISLGPGDFFHVPAHTVHREVNPSADKGREAGLIIEFKSFSLLPGVS